MLDRKNLRSLLKALAFLSPALILILIFNIYPLINTIMMSFYTDYDYFRDIVYEVGFGNYSYIFNDAYFINSLKNTMLYVFTVVPISIFISLVIATMLNTKLKGIKFFQTVYFLPFVTSAIAMGMVFRVLFHSQYGIINSFLGLFGVDAIGWLADPNYAMPALIIFGIWNSLAFNIIILLAGLQGVNPQYYKVARIDGASTRMQFFNITIPLVSPTLIFVLITSFINSFKVYTEVYALHGHDAGPGGSAMTLVFYIYDKFYGATDFAVASAAAVVLLVIVLAFTMVKLWINKKFVHY